MSVVICYTAIEIENTCQPKQDSQEKMMFLQGPYIWRHRVLLRIECTIWHIGHIVRKLAIKKVAHPNWVIKEILIKCEDIREMKKCWGSIPGLSNGREPWPLLALKGGSRYWNSKSSWTERAIWQEPWPAVEACSQPEISQHRNKLENINPEFLLLSPSNVPIVPATELTKQETRD